MKVDMSPKAIKARLYELNDLWELSVRLMNNKKVGGVCSEKSEQEKSGKIRRVDRRPIK